MTKWEYLMMRVPEEAPKEPALGHWGDQGWELVAITPAQNGNGMIWVFKRPKQDGVAGGG